ncbi:chemotaxis protein CheW [Myxococcaceae bacterium GXIMD 01537]
MAEKSTSPAEALTRRASVEQQLAALEAEQARLRRELASLGSAVRLPGLFLTVVVGESAALLPAEAVQEVVRLVELDPLPGAPAHVSGTFLYRGEPAVAVDLAVMLGVRREPELDSHLVICRGSRVVALLVDRVNDLVEAPLLVDAAPGEDGRTPWDGSGLMAGLCRTPDGIRPLLRASVLLAAPEAP